MLGERDVFFLFVCLVFFFFSTGSSLKEYPKSNASCAMFNFYVLPQPLPLCSHHQKRSGVHLIGKIFHNCVSHLMTFFIFPLFKISLNTHEVSSGLPLCRRSQTVFFCHCVCVWLSSLVGWRPSLIDAPVTYSPGVFQFAIIWFGGIAVRVTRLQMVLLIFSW